MYSVELFGCFCFCFCFCFCYRRLNWPPIHLFLLRSEADGYINSIEERSYGFFLSRWLSVQRSFYHRAFKSVDIDFVIQDTPRWIVDVPFGPSSEIFFGQQVFLYDLAQVCDRGSCSMAVYSCRSTTIVESSPSLTKVVSSVLRSSKIRSNVSVSSTKRHFLVEFNFVA